MGRITLELLRKRAEHNDSVLFNLKEIGLHQQNLERIELIGDVCRELQILYLQSNVISVIENLHHLKELRYLNLAMNNIVEVENLQSCESLQKLDLTMNFIPVSALPSFSNLKGLRDFQELYLLGNPCHLWHLHRNFIIMQLPQLQKLDGDEIFQAERDAAGEREDELHLALKAHVKSCPVPESGASTGVLHQDSSGEVRRPWCPEARLAEHLEHERLNKQVEEKKRASQRQLLGVSSSKPPYREDFPPLSGEDTLKQKNEGKWCYTFRDQAKEVLLAIATGQGVLAEDVKAEIHAHFVRLLIKGRLLQLETPEEVKPEESKLVRSKASGSIEICMPKNRPLLATRQEEAEQSKPKQWSDNCSWRVHEGNVDTYWEESTDLAILD